MSSLYKLAAALPRRLAGGHKVRRYPDEVAAAATAEAVRWRVRRGATTRPYHGVYVSGTDPDLLDRLNALLLLLPEEAAIAFHTAAALHGFGVVPANEVHVVVPRGSPVPQIRGVRAHEAVLTFEPVDVLGLPCVPAARTAVDLARTVRRIDALPILDAALFCGATTPEDLTTEMHRQDGLRGVRQARELVPLADPRPECRQESQARLILHDGRLPMPTPQVPVYDDGGYPIFVLDLGYEEAMVGVEYDGESHLNRERMRSDRDRHNYLEGRGWTMRYATDRHIYRTPHTLVEAVRRALHTRARRRSRPNWGGMKIKAPQ